MKIKINKDYLKLVPRPSEEDYNNIYNSIKNDGFDEAQRIIINQDGYILDGHTRFNICQELEIAPPFVIKEFKDKLEEKLYVIKTARDRRHLSVGQKAMLSLVFIDIYRELAKQRQLSTLKQGEKTPVTQNFVERGETTEQAGKEFGISGESVRKAEKIKKDKELSDMVEKGEVSLDEAYQKVREKEEEKRKKDRLKELPKIEGLILGDYLPEIPKLEDDSINCLITDLTQGLKPEESEDFDKDAIIAPLHKMLSKLSLKMANNSFVYLFTKWKDLKNIISIVEKYFKMKNILVWDKNMSGNLDNNYFPRSEYIIFAVKGNPILNSISEDRDNILSFSRISIGEKPIDLLEYLIYNSTIEGELIFDPLAGTGNTLIAAKNLKRKFLGIESSKSKYETALIKLSESND